MLGTFLDELTRRNVKLDLGGSIHDPTDPVGRPLFNVLVMVAKFESDLIRLRTREGMKVGKAKGRLLGKQPKLKPNQAKHLLKLHDSGNCTQAKSPNSSASGDRRSTELLKGCGPNPPNLSGHSPHLVAPSPNAQTSASRESQPTN
jgi:DNA invertase Pin-like site-specific DNA recombinase